MLSKCNGRLLEGFKQNGDESIFIFYKFNLTVMWVERSREKGWGTMKRVRIWFYKSWWNMTRARKCWWHCRRWECVYRGDPFGCVASRTCWWEEKRGIKNDSCVFVLSNSTEGGAMVGGGQVPGVVQETRVLFWNWWIWRVGLECT